MSSKPKTIIIRPVLFGLLDSELRARSIIRLLRYFGFEVSGNTRKAVCLEKLAKLEDRLNEREKAAVKVWLNNGTRSLKRLAGLLGDANRSPIRVEASQNTVVGNGESHPVCDHSKDESCVLQECAVCFTSVPVDDFPKTLISSGCKHQPTTCNRCLTTYMNFQVQTKAWDQISCPECAAKLSDAEIKMHASPEIVERNTRKSFLISIQHLPNFTFCLASGCDEGQIHTGPEQPMMTCATCHFKTCFNHKLPWHEGLTCEEFDARNPDRVRQEAASEEYMKLKTKLCPNPECGMRLQKEAGCNAVYCDYCLQQFCWTCRADYGAICKYGNDRHEPECQYHEDKKNGIPGHGGYRNTDKVLKRKRDEELLG